jgi:methyl acetate hydrolase
MTLQKTADELLQNAVGSGSIPGVAATATNREGVTYSGAFGKRIQGESAEMTPDTVVWIASMTKALTSTAAMMLVEQGKLSLDGPAKEVLPYLGEVPVLEGFEDDGTPRTRPPQSDITLRQLLTHTAGFSYEIWNADIMRYQEKMGLPGITGCENKALETPLLFDPGTRWEYGINIDWAGKMIEAVSGQKLGDFLQENLFAPLGMSSTAFFITPEMRSRMAKIHQRGEDAALTPVMELEIPQEPEFQMGGGGLYGTIEDYLKFVQLILNDGKVGSTQLLQPQTVDALTANAMGETKVTVMRATIPPLSNDAEFFPGLSKNWSTAFMINEEQAPTGRSAGSLAWAGLANTYYWIDRSKGVGGVYATQILPFADQYSLPLFLAFEKSVYSFS